MENAIIMASGLGIRMRPITEHTAKPLIKVHGKPMIETVIEGLNRRQINQIFVVVGYLGEQFLYLKEKYQNVYIIDNPDYQSVNNISSVFAARNVLGCGNCFICEADLFISDYSLFEQPLEHSCYFGKMIKGHSEDWVFELDANGYISRVGKNGDNCFNMVGIAYFKEEEGLVLKKCIEKEYGLKGYKKLFWDDVVNKNLNMLKLIIQPITQNQIVEVDTVEELLKLENEYF